MRAGFKEFVVLPSDGERLRAVVRAGRAFRQGGDEEKGRVVAVAGSKGGVGVTLAVHLAAELAGIHRVLLVDLDFGMGNVAPMMDLTSRDSIVDLIMRGTDRLDERVLTSAVVVHRSKVNVLTMPDDLENAV